MFWYKGDIKLRLIFEYRIYFINNVVIFVFNKVNIYDSGEYICKVENSIGIVFFKIIFRI